MGKPPRHDRDTINLVAAVLLCVLWAAVVMVSAALRPATPEIEKALTWLFGAATLLTGLGGLVWRQVLRIGAALEVSQRQIQRLAVTDSMTGVFNHSGFVSLLERDIGRAKRYGHPLSVMVMDIDFFRRLNDGYGHDVGDRVIVSLAMAISGALRNTDFVGRVSGAGFALGLPETTVEQARLLAERLRERIADIEVQAEGGEHVRYTVSIGVAMLEREDAMRLMARGRRAMHQAKDEGRNRVVADLPLVPSETVTADLDGAADA
jgi:diguanylate cyclase (GGDEF)-like protein